MHRNNNFFLLNKCVSSLLEISLLIWSPLYIIFLSRKEAFLSVTAEASVHEELEVCRLWRVCSYTAHLNRPCHTRRKHRIYIVPSTLVYSLSTKGFQDVLNSFLNQGLNLSDISHFYIFPSKPMKGELKTYLVSEISVWDRWVYVSKSDFSFQPVGCVWRPSLPS